MPSSRKQNRPRREEFGGGWKRRVPTALCAVINMLSRTPRDGPADGEPTGPQDSSTLSCSPPGQPNEPAGTRAAWARVPGGAAASRSGSPSACWPAPGGLPPAHTATLALRHGPSPGQLKIKRVLTFCFAFSAELSVILKTRQVRGE